MKPVKEPTARLELIPGVVLVKSGSDEITMEAHPAALEGIACVCHEANRAYCRTLGDDSQPSWEDAPDWQRASAMQGVLFHLMNPSAGAQASHESWLREKSAAGWKYGPEKNAERKEHPCFVPFHHLPKDQQVKDYLFRSIIHAHVEAYQR